ncbi:phage terminase small subunit [Zooshikella ganghwensis]|uniref:phage terminase small subunit n=1 Tax=Zooshikella ganghwensis TaxID=202772 RepID=UPI0004242BE0|nr:phage terminase small subunit [Zooshikella ganghwensis]
MLSLAMRQRQREAQEEKAEHMPFSPDSAFASLANAKKFCQLQLCSLRLDLAQIGKLKNYPEKAEFKRTLIDKYQYYLDGYLASGLEHPNEILVYMVIWHFDTNQLFIAYKLAKMAIQQNQPMPETFKRRDVTTFACDEVLRAMERKIEHSDIIFNLVLEDLQNGTWDVIPEIKARYFKIAGTRAEENNQLDDALLYFEKAHNTWEKIGVKTRLDKLRNKLTK